MTGAPAFTEAEPQPLREDLVQPCRDWRRAAGQRTPALALPPQSGNRIYISLLLAYGAMPRAAHQPIWVVGRLQRAIGNRSCNGAGSPFTARKCMIEN